MSKKSSPPSKKLKTDSSEAGAVPTNGFVCPMLTDMYQISMTYAYWKAGKVDEYAVFDLFFRKAPFSGEFAIFAGLDEVVPLLQNFKFTADDVAYLQTILPGADPEFFTWILSLDCSRTKVYAVQHGLLVYPREPLLRIEGPLCVGQLLETVLLNLINYPSLVATNAARMKLAAGANKSLLEFGLRRAQGPDGAYSASKYSYLGGFHGTSNVLAGKLTGITVKGTHAHAFVMSFKALDDVKCKTIVSSTGKTVNFVDLVLEKREELGYFSTNTGELAAFISYSQSFPNGFLALIDTYDTLNSGVKNYIAVALVLHDLGYNPLGIRLDSGDLSYLSKACRDIFRKVDEKMGIDFLSSSNIVASDDINEDILLALKDQGSEIDTFGIGTNLVTCQKQPALGCVYKLVCLNDDPRIKLSQNPTKMVIPYKKDIFRLYGQSGYPLLDMMTLSDESEPLPGVTLRCMHPFDDKKRVNVTPSRVERLLNLIWDGTNGIVRKTPTLSETRDFTIAQLGNMREDHVRSLNPTPYKVSVSADLYAKMHQLWEKNAPPMELS